MNTVDPNAVYALLLLILIATLKGKQGLRGLYLAAWVGLGLLLTGCLFEAYLKFQSLYH